MRRLRVAMCQIRTTVGDLDANVARIREALAEADSAGADVAVFPELAICGYPPEDLLLKPGFVRDCEAALESLAEEVIGCAAVIGTVEGHRDLFNAAVLCANGEIVHRQAKRILPNYGVFDERRYFTPGSGEHQLVDLGDIRVGMAICEDIWSPTGPLHTQAVGGAEVVLVPNGSPFSQGRSLERDILLSARSADNSCAIVYVNQVGGQDELVFDGGSVAFDHHGSLVARSPLFVEEVTVVDLDVPPAYRKRRLDPRGQEEPSPPLDVVARVDTPHAGSPRRVPGVASVADLPGPLQEIWQALVVGTRDYVTKNGFSDVGIALSGGIDSSVVVAVAADAVGAENVHAVLMPSRYSSDHSITDAVVLCENFGVEHRTIPIEAAHAALGDMLAPSFEGRETDVTEENLQSRIRGVLMMALSNKLGWMILTTGNKSELAVGYSTLYGDTAGGYAVIKDVYKTTVYDLARWRNEQAGTDLIPRSVIEKAPSAELRPDQRDDQSLPSYEVLDALLFDHIEQDRTAADLIADGHDADLVRRILRLVDLAEYKRRQNPPGIRVTPKAFGRDRRMPITNRYRG